MRCLILDNEEMPRHLFSQLVIRMGHRALAVESEDAALVAAVETPYDLAIVDMELDSGSGASTIAGLRRECPHIRILVVSGHSDPRHVMAAIAAGADGYLLKDEAGESLEQAIQEVRAGYTPLSSRVAGIVVRKLRSRGQPVARLRSPR
jgi:DNA-binding NarL/FixJ family response regulator